MKDPTLATPIHTAQVARELEERRAGVNDPQRQIVVELQNITAILLELLKTQRKEK